MGLRNDFYHFIRDLGRRMPKQIQHDFESLLAWDLLQIGPALRGNLIVALRKSGVEDVKIQFTEELRISIMSSRGSRGNGLSVDFIRRQFRFVDVDDSVERIKNERGIIHGSTALEYPIRG